MQYTSCFSSVSSIAEKGTEQLTWNYFKPLKGSDEISLS